MNKKLTALLLSALVLPKGTFFLCDTYVIPDPSAAQLAEITLRARGVELEPADEKP